MQRCELLLYSKVTRLHMHMYSFFPGDHRILNVVPCATERPRRLPTLRVTRGASCWCNGLYLLIQSPNPPLLHSFPLASPSNELSGCRNSPDSHENPLRCSLISLPFLKEELKPKDDSAHGPRLQGLVQDPVYSYSSVILLNLPFLVYIFIYLFF